MVRYILYISGGGVRTVHYICGQGVFDALVCCHVEIQFLDSFGVWKRVESHACRKFQKMNRFCRDFVSLCELPIRKGSTSKILFGTLLKLFETFGTSGLEYF